MRAECVPHLVGEDGMAAALERVPLNSREFPEGQLQELLHRNPSLLPFSRFDSAFGPLASLGREIRRIDNLFIGPNGRLTLVETKLWRNPQATRHALAQILDYASMLSRLSCEELESLCHEAIHSPLQAGRSLYEFVENAFPGQAGTESEFLDNLHRSLRTGRFLLLIIGDGIRENLENVLDLLYRQSRLNFTFGLLELGLYRSPANNGYVVVPSLLAHSTEIERAVVTIRGAESPNIDVEIRSDPRTMAPKLTEQEFLDAIEDPETRQFGNRLFEWAREYARIELAKNGKSAIVRMPFSTMQAGLILLRLFQGGRVLLTPPRLRKALSRADGGDVEVLRLAEALRIILPELSVDQTKAQVLPSMQARYLLPHMDQIIEIYAETIDRLKALDPGLHAEPDEESGNDDEDDA